ncbi:MAG: hypothetical protein LBC07_03955 [Elusimicrobiota bacterium]|nr:hypothetical protein [Elusimicrobiota bacterium]
MAFCWGAFGAAKNAKGVKYMSAVEKANRQKAQAQDPDAQYNLKLIYSEGCSSVKQDFQKAR